jgi:hypothetical protein
VDESIRIDNLPITSSTKQIYRTDAEGKEPYKLVGTVTGSQATFLDQASDDERANIELTKWKDVNRSTNVSRSYVVSLTNVRDIRPPGS